MYRLAPWLPVYKSDGQTYDLSYNSGYNPVAVQETTNRNAKTYNINANASTSYKIMDGLTYEGSFALISTMPSVASIMIRGLVMPMWPLVG